jgi:hypothetical protein
MKRPVRAHVYALLAAFVAVVVVSALWIVNLRMGPPLDGFTGGPMVIFVPFFLLILSGLWFAVRAVLHGRVHWRWLTVIVAAAALAVAPVILYCGPVACFTPGANRQMGWFVVGGLALVALVHHIVLNATSRGARHAA